MSESHIVSDPRIMMGKPVVVGTRITVELILDKLGAGETFEQLLEEHPRLTEDSIRAALAFAGDARDWMVDSFPWRIRRLGQDPS